MSPGDVRYATSGDGTHLAFEVLGQGPALLYVPPGASHLELKWDEPGYAQWLRRLASFSRLVVMDKRGCGLSDRAADMPTAEQQMEDVGAVLDAAGAARAWLLGALDGGVSCLLYAAHHPDRVCGVIAYASFARGMWSEDHPIGFRSEMVDLLTAAVEHGDHAAALPLLAPTMAGDAGFEAWLVRYLRSACSPSEVARWLRQQLSLDVRDVLHTVGVPVLVLHRAADRFVPVGMSRDLASRLPNARLVELPGDDYFMWVGDADAVVGEIEEFVVGTRTAPDHERALATVLFTDIVDSTGLAARVGDARWRALLDRHDGLVAAAAARHRGVVVKTTGDGALMRFDGPARAVRCALRISQDAAAVGLELRAGVHTGEVELRGDDVGGIAVHIAARVQASAAPSEVLVSRTVTDLVVGSGLTFESRGSHVLKGVPGTWELFAVQPAPSVRAAET